MVEEIKCLSLTYNEIIKEKKITSRAQWLNYIDSHIHSTWISIRCPRQRISAVVRLEALGRYMDHLELDYKTLIVEPVNDYKQLE